MITSTNPEVVVTDGSRDGRPGRRGAIVSNGPTITIVGDFADLPAASYQALARLLLAMSEPDTPPDHQPGHAEARAVAESMPDAESDTRNL